MESESPSHKLRCTRILLRMTGLGPLQLLAGAWSRQSCSQAGCPRLSVFLLIGGDRMTCSHIAVLPLLTVCVTPKKDTKFLLFSGSPAPYVKWVIMRIKRNKAEIQKKKRKKTPTCSPSTRWSAYSCSDCPARWCLSALHASITVLRTIFPKSLHGFLFPTTEVSVKISHWNSLPGHFYIK